MDSLNETNSTTETNTKSTTLNENADSITINPHKINKTEPVTSSDKANNSEEIKSNVSDTLQKSNVASSDTYGIESSIQLDAEDLVVNDKILQQMGLSKKTDNMQEVVNKIRQNLNDNITKIDTLVQLGMINNNIGKNLKRHVLQKAFDNILMQEKTIEQYQNLSNIYDEFNKKSDNFFGIEGRKDVFDYLKRETSGMTHDDLYKISGIIKNVEKAAITRYLKNIAHERNLTKSNDTAKSRLTSNAQYADGSAKLPHIFTRAQIDKMSNDEFLKNEKAIFQQLKEGKIR